MWVHFRVETIGYHPETDLRRLRNLEVRLDSYIKVYIHLVWGTWDRQPLIDEAFRKPIYQVIHKTCQLHNCLPIAIGGTTDHIHVLIALASTISIADLVKHVKGSSSHFVTHELSEGIFFKWQKHYGAFSVSVHKLDRVKQYVEHQKEHHSNNELIPELESVDGGRLCDDSRRF